MKVELISSIIRYASINVCLYNEMRDNVFTLSIYRNNIAPNFTPYLSHTMNDNMSVKGVIVENMSLISTPIEMQIAYRKLNVNYFFFLLYTDTTLN